MFKRPRPQETSPTSSQTGQTLISMNLPVKLCKLQQISCSIIQVLHCSHSNRKPTRSRFNPVIVLLWFDWLTSREEELQPAGTTLTTGWTRSTTAFTRVIKYAPNPNSNISLKILGRKMTLSVMNFQCWSRNWLIPWDRPTDRESKQQLSALELMGKS